MPFEQSKQETGGCPHLAAVQSAVERSKPEMALLSTRGVEVMLRDEDISSHERLSRSAGKVALEDALTAFGTTLSALFDRHEPEVAVYWSDFLDEPEYALRMCGVHMGSGTHGQFSDALDHLAREMPKLDPLSSPRADHLSLCHDLEVDLSVFRRRAFSYGGMGLLAHRASATVWSGTTLPEIHVLQGASQRLTQRYIPSEANSVIGRLSANEEMIPISDVGDMVDQRAIADVLARAGIDSETIGHDVLALQRQLVALTCGEPKHPNVYLRWKRDGRSEAPWHLAVEEYDDTGLPGPCPIRAGMREIGDELCACIDRYIRAFDVPDAIDADLTVYSTTNLDDDRVVVLSVTVAGVTATHEHNHESHRERRARGLHPDREIFAAGARRIVTALHFASLGVPAPYFVAVPGDFSGLVLFASTPQHAAWLALEMEPAAAVLDTFYRIAAIDFDMTPERVG